MWWIGILAVLVVALFVSKFDNIAEEIRKLRIEQAEYFAEYKKRTGMQ